MFFLHYNDDMGTFLFLILNPFKDLFELTFSTFSLVPNRPSALSYSLFLSAADNSILLIRLK